MNRCVFGIAWMGRSCYKVCRLIAFRFIISRFSISCVHRYARVLGGLNGWPCSIILNTRCRIIIDFGIAYSSVMIRENGTGDGSIFSELQYKLFLSAVKKKFNTRV